MKGLFDETVTPAPKLPVQAIKQHLFCKFIRSVSDGLAHSTGHASRLNRDIGTKISPFGSPDYSKEELVAEMGSAFLCAASGISPPTIDQSAAYIDGWRKKLKDDKRLVIQAAGQGQRAVDYIRGVTFEAK